MKFVVTGGAGFIGSNIIWELNNRGYNDITIVEDFSLMTNEKLMNITHLNYKNLISDRDLIDERRKYQEHKIIHMGADSSTKCTFARAYSANYSYTMNLMKDFKRIVYASSTATYGTFDSPISETDKCAPINFYGLSKHLIDLNSRGHIGLKYSNVFGPNEYHKDDMASVLFKSAVRINGSMKPLLFTSEIEPVRDFVYSKVVAKCTVDFALNDAPAGTYNIGSGTTTSFRQIVEWLQTDMSGEINVAEKEIWLL